MPQNIFYVDYATSSSSKKLAVAINDEPPVLIGGTLLEFLCGKGNRHSSIDGQTVFLPAQIDLFGTMGKGDSSIEGQKRSLEPNEGLDMGKWNPEMGNVHPYPGPNDIIVIETNFECHNPYERNQIIDTANEKGIIIKTLPLRTTGKIKRILDRALAPENFEKEYQEDMMSWAEQRGLVLYEHDDMRAVEAIRYCYKTGQNVSSPQKVDIKEWEAKPLVKQFQAIRTDHLDTSHPFVKKMCSYIPISPLMNCDLDIQEFYVQDGKFQLTVAILTIIAALETNTRKEFDRMLGLYGSGYPGIFRSSFIRRAKVLAARVIGEDWSAWQYERHLVPGEIREAMKDKMKLTRRASRKFRRLILDEISDLNH